MDKNYTGTSTHKKTKSPIKGYNGDIIAACKPINNRVLIGIPATGLVRI